MGSMTATLTSDEIQWVLESLNSKQQVALENTLRLNWLNQVAALLQRLQEGGDSIHRASLGAAIAELSIAFQTDAEKQFETLANNMKDPLSQAPLTTEEKQEKISEFKSAVQAVVAEPSSWSSLVTTTEEAVTPEVVAGVQAQLIEEQESASEARDLAREAVERDVARLEEGMPAHVRVPITHLSDYANQEATQMHVSYGNPLGADDDQDDDVEMGIGAYVTLDPKIYEPFERLFAQLAALPQDDQADWDKWVQSAYGDSDAHVETEAADFEEEEEEIEDDNWMQRMRSDIFDSPVSQAEESSSDSVGSDAVADAMAQWRAQKTKDIEGMDYSGTQSAYAQTGFKLYERRMPTVNLFDTGALSPVAHPPAAAA